MNARQALSVSVLTVLVNACAGANEATVLRLDNGIVLPVHEAGKLQKQCEFYGEVVQSESRAQCVEFPASAISEEFEPLNWYTPVLIEAGFQWASGAANQYWFNWSTKDNCFERLNVTAMPKERIESDDWSKMKDYVAVFEFENEERCEEK